MVAASELESNISSANLTQNINYFYVLIIAMQNKQILLKRYDFFHTLLASTKF